MSEENKFNQRFVNGMAFRKPSEKAPDFIKGKLSIKVEDFKRFLDENQKDGWVNIDLKESKQGNYYAAVDDWVPTQEANPEQDSVSQDNDETSADQNIPF